MRDFFEMVVFPIALILSIFALFFGGLFVAVDWYAEYQCSNYEEITGHETRYARFDQCYVRTIHGFQRWDEYKVRALASEGLSRSQSE